MWVVVTQDMILSMSEYKQTQSLYDTLSQYPGGDYLTHREKYKIFLNFSGCDLGVVFSTGGYQVNQSRITWTFSELKWQTPGWTKNIEVAE